MKSRRLKVAYGVVGAAVAVAAAAGWLRHHTTRYDEEIAQAAWRHSVDFHLVKALVWEESWFRAEARGAAGEVGLMQITMAAATDFSTRKGFPPFHENRLLEPRLNLEIGCWYLRQSLDRYKDAQDPTFFALLRYNAGEAHADEWLKLSLSRPAPADTDSRAHYLSLVDFPTTREYARRVLRRARDRNFWF